MYLNSERQELFEELDVSFKYVVVSDRWYYLTYRRQIRSREPITALSTGTVKFLFK